MWTLTRRIASRLKKRKIDPSFLAAIRQITGVSPINLKLYELAVQHASVAQENEKGIRESNERLEYLGDAILGAVVAEYLFKKYPYKNEGFLTEIRARIVNRESLNLLGKKLGIAQILEFDQSNKSSLSHKSIFGDTLEALIGAVYLDHRYKSCKKFIEQKLLIHFDLEEIISTNTNYKSTLIEWAQKNGKEVKFEIVEVKGQKQFKEFTAQVWVDKQPLGLGYGFSKKKAEQSAALTACEDLQLI